MSKVNDGEVNVNKLRELCNEFAANRDSLLGIYACGKNNGGYYVVGEAWKFIEAFYNILERGLQPDAEEHIQHVALSIVEGIKKLIRTNSQSANTFVESISPEDVVDDDEDELDLSSAQCMNCKDLVACIKKSFANIGIDVDIKVKNDRRKFIIGGSDVAS